MVDPESLVSPRRGGSNDPPTTTHSAHGSTSSPEDHQEIDPNHNQDRKEDQDDDYPKSSPLPTPLCCYETTYEADGKPIENDRFLLLLDRLARFLGRYSVESIGIQPLPLSKRTDEQWWSVGTLWFSCNVNVLAFSTGTLAPHLGLGMTSSMLTILFFGLLCAIFPAYFTTFGPKLGLRQMVHARYSFGYFGTMLVCLLNGASMLGYCILNSIVGGQTLSAVAGGDSSSLTPTVGIAVSAVIALAVSFSGIRILHYFERWLWLPVMICFILLTAFAGTGEQGLHVPQGRDPANARSVLAMGSIMAGYIISYSSLSSDMAHYLRPTTSSWKLFWAVYAGFFLSCAPFIMLGAAFGISATEIPAWQEALEVSTGKLFDLILCGKAKGFGKVLTVILALSVTGNVTATLYSFGLNLQTMIPFLGRVPRFIWPILATAIYLPLAIVGADSFYPTLSNFASMLGYWSSLFVSVVTVDHVVVRRSDFSTYDLQIWNDWRRLPTGSAALTACFASLALLVPCIDQVWFTGPIAKRSGDLGFEVGLVLCAVLYLPLRLVEKRLSGR